MWAHREKSTVGMKVDFLSLKDVTAMHGGEIREVARRVINAGSRPSAS